MAQKSEARKEADARWREANREKLNLGARKRRAKFRSDVLEHYGTSCAHCGFDDTRALCIDHIENNGGEERRQLGSEKFSGWKFYEHLKKEGYPEGYQTLCWNCNAIKQVERNGRVV